MELVFYIVNDFWCIIHNVTILIIMMRWQWHENKDRTSGKAGTIKRLLIQFFVFQSRGQQSSSGGGSSVAASGRRPRRPRRRQNQSRQESKVDDQPGLLVSFLWLSSLESLLESRAENQQCFKQKEFIFNVQNKALGSTISRKIFSSKNRSRIVSNIL